MTTIPNELKITINTGIHGFKKVTYKPSMSISNISSNDTSVQFNPLVKLNETIVNDVPENLRKKDFVNKHEFQSLINFIDPSASISLAQATQRGYVDNNIKITLNTIFPENSVIYINNKPYVITDVQWSKGDWKIDTKYQPHDKHYLYTNQLRDQIRLGNEQLEKLPLSVVYGVNYNGPKKKIGPTGASSGVTGASTGVTGAASGITGAASGVTGASTGVTGASTGVTGAASGITGAPLPRASITPPINLYISNNATSNLRNYFRNQIFYFCVNNVFNKMNDREKYNINKILLHTTKLNIDETELNINKEAYNDSVKSIFVNSASPDGNCFFTSVANAINYNNYTNEADQIVHGIYGRGDKIFTPTYLRSLVLKYFLSNANRALYETYRQNALANANELNTIFHNHVEEIQNASGPGFILTSDRYVEIANDIHSSMDNFLVNQVTQVPIDVRNYYKPFTIMNEAQIRIYLMSKKYWANELAIYALCYEIELNIIPIHKVDKLSNSYALKIPFGNFSKTTQNNWSRYLFLYWSDGHYELMSFNFIERKPIISFNAPQTISYLTKKQTVFKRNDPTTIVPLCILFLIFGEYYYRQTDEIKQNFSFCPKIMQLFEDKLNEALRDPSVTSTLTANYNAIFENSIIANSPSATASVGVTRGGGFNGSSYYSNPNYGYYGKNYPSHYNQPYGPNYPSHYNQPYGPNYPSRYNQQYGPNYPSRYNQPYGPNYPSRYNQYYGPNYNNSLQFRNSQKDSVYISYYISVDMELYPGTKIPPEESKNLGCNKKWNSVRKAYSDFRGKPYVIQPVYKIDKTSKNIKSQNNEQTKKNAYNLNNATRKYYNNQNTYYGNDRRNRTRRYYNNY